jgi:hypothetical protein
VVEGSEWNTRGAFLLSLSRARQLSRDVPVDVGFLCDKADVLFAEINKKTVVSRLWRCQLNVWGI